MIKLDSKKTQFEEKYGNGEINPENYKVTL